DQEVAWLHPATNIATWERFVAGLKEIEGIEIDEQEAFPEDSMALPVVGIRKPGHAGTLWLRWYKLTGLRTIEVWVRDLCKRNPPPIAVVGGGNSERALAVARALKQMKQEKPTIQLPVFLISTATADNVQHPELGITELMQIYPQRTFRFCFTNHQMAESICDFVQNHISHDPALQISSSRISLISWQDDPFSEDLVEQFEENWRTPSGAIPNPPVWSYRIGHSVGGLNLPNKLEAEAVRQLVDVAHEESLAVRGRELLVLPGGPAPARRVLRSLYRTDPNERFFWVVTVGDAIDWNTLYRDRRLTWSIEDVPFPLLVFMHRNPVERHLRQGKGFSAEDDSHEGFHATGTDDLLLYRDMGISLVEGSFLAGIVQDSEHLLASLRHQQDSTGTPLFDEVGNR
ncbi:MAG TPA: hypothetical protein PKA06_16445, partial [Gemmatales bacterium]|nr:hypothetical protein [Gemmatales bacterium]